MKEKEQWQCPQCKNIYAVDKENDFSQSFPSCDDCNKYLERKE